MENKFLISKAKDCDYDELREIYLNVRKETFDWLNSERYQLSDFDESTNGELILTAKLNDKIVGFISIWEADKFIHNLFVTREYQGMGVGTALIKATVQIMGLPLTLKCMKKNEKAIKFYTNNNWNIISEEYDSNGPYYLMRYDNEI